MAYLTEAQEWSAKYAQLHKRPGLRTARLSAQGARILHMLAPHPWEPGYHDITIVRGARGATVQWAPEMDSFVVGHARDAAYSGFPRGDARAILRAFEHEHGAARRRRARSGAARPAWTGRPR